MMQWVHPVGLDADVVQVRVPVVGIVPGVKLDGQAILDARIPWVRVRLRVRYVRVLRIKVSGNRTREPSDSG